MLSPFGCAVCGRGLYVLSGRLGKLRQAAALLIDKGEVLGAGTVRIKRRKRLLDIRIDLPGSKDLVVLATLGDELVYVVVGVPQEVANFVWKLAGAAVVAVCLMVQCASGLAACAFRGVIACERDARCQVHKTCREVAGVVALLGECRFGARVSKVSGEAIGPICVYERPAGAPDQNAQMDAERIKLVIALSDNVEQMCSAILDRRSYTRAVLIGIDSWIGKERCRLDARKHGRAVANNRRLKRWNVYSSSHDATAVLSC